MVLVVIAIILLANQIGSITENIFIMNEKLSKLIQVECEYLINSGWVCVEENTWDHHVWNYPSDNTQSDEKRHPTLDYSLNSNYKSHNKALEIQKRRDGEY